MRALKIFSFGLSFNFLTTVYTKMNRHFVLMMAEQAVSETQPSKKATTPMTTIPVTTSTTSMLTTTTTVPLPTTTEEPRDLFSCFCKYQDLFDRKYNCLD